MCVLLCLLLCQVTTMYIVLSGQYYAYCYVRALLCLLLCQGTTMPIVLSEHNYAYCSVSTLLCLLFCQHTTMPIVLSGHHYAYCSVRALLWLLLCQGTTMPIVLSGHISHDLAGYYKNIVPWDIVVQIPTMQGSTICCHEHFVIISDVKNGDMTTPAANNGHDDVTMVWNVVTS